MMLSQLIDNTSTKIQVKAIAGQALSVSYNTLPGNRPNSYGNFLLAWQNQDSIPYNNDNPTGIQFILNNNPSGSVVFQDLMVQIGVSYVVGYSVGRQLPLPSQKWGNVVSTTYIPAADEAGIPFIPEITDVQPGPNSVFFRYSLPPGNNPLSNRAWVGIWNNSVASYDQEPMAACNIGLSSSQGNTGINGISILRGNVYTIALMSSGWESGPGRRNIQTSMACTYTFYS